MSDFPRTQIEDLSVPRLIAGANWFMGATHQSVAKDRFIRHHMTRERIADVLEVFFNAGVNAVLGAGPSGVHLNQAIADAEDRTGREAIKISAPALRVDRSAEADDENARVLDAYAEIGCRVCMPHQSTTDAMISVPTRRIEDMERLLAMIRERGMIPGLSTHRPESVLYADETKLDVGTYIQIYNAAGFLMQVEVDWAQRVIHGAARPVLTIKPLAAGHLPPLVGLAFSWATLRKQDMVAVGTMTPDEAREVIDISLSIMEGRLPERELQVTRSKYSLTGEPMAQ